MNMSRWVFAGVLFTAIAIVAATSFAFTNNSSTATVGFDQGADRFFCDGCTMDVRDTAVVNGLMKVAKATFQYSASNQGLGSSSLGMEIPANAVVMDGLIDVQTGCSTANGNGTIALALEGANDIVSAATVSSAWTAGRHNIIPDGTAANSKKTTVQRGLSIVTGTQVLNACKFSVWLRYFVSE